MGLSAISFCCLYYTSVCICLLFFFLFSIWSHCVGASNVLVCVYACTLCVCIRACICKRAYISCTLGVSILIMCTHITYAHVCWCQQQQQQPSHQQQRLVKSVLHYGIFCCRYREMLSVHLHKHKHTLTYTLSSSSSSLCTSIFEILCTIISILRHKFVWIFFYQFTPKKKINTF